MSLIVKNILFIGLILSPRAWFLVNTKLIILKLFYYQIKKLLGDELGKLYIPQSLPLFADGPDDYDDDDDDDTGGYDHRNHIKFLRHRLITGIMIINGIDEIIMKKRYWRQAYCHRGSFLLMMAMMMIIMAPKKR